MKLMELSKAGGSADARNNSTEDRYRTGSTPGKIIPVS
jgi:hypothetical protein